MDIGSADLRAARAACRRWLPDVDFGIRAMSHAGFSGGGVYVVDFAGAERWVLKSLPGGTATARVELVHRLMRHAREAGVAEVPPVRTLPDGSTTVAVGGTRWELVRFVRGDPIDAPSAAEAAAAGDAVARLHRALAMCPGLPARVDRAPSVVRRRERARRLLAAPWRSRLHRRHAGAAGRSRLAAAVTARLERGCRIFAAAEGPVALARVAARRPEAVPLQAVIRDLRCDHVFYAPGETGMVAGIIDYHAAGVDTPATDLARLIGSWRHPDEAGHTVRAYESVRSLSETERSLIPWLAATAEVFGLDNWFRWVLDDGRRFVDPDAVLGRIDRLLESLPHALTELASSTTGAANVGD